MANGLAQATQHGIVSTPRACCFCMTAPFPIQCAEGRDIVASVLGRALQTVFPRETMGFQGVREEKRNKQWCKNCQPTFKSTLFIVYPSQSPRLGTCLPRDKLAEILACCMSLRSFSWLRVCGIRILNRRRFQGLLSPTGQL